MIATICRSCDRAIAGDAALDERQFFHHPDCLAPARHTGRWCADDRQRIALTLASPKRADPGRVVVDQADVAHLPLFVAANEPRLL